MNSLFIPSLVLAVVLTAYIPVFGLVSEFITTTPVDPNSQVSSASSYSQNTATVNINLDLVLVDIFA